MLGGSIAKAALKLLKVQLLKFFRHVGIAKLILISRHDVSQADASINKNEWVTLNKYYFNYIEIVINHTNYTNWRVFVLYYDCEMKCSLYCMCNKSGAINQILTYLQTAFGSLVYF